MYLEMHDLSNSASFIRESTLSSNLIFFMATNSFALSSSAIYTVLNPLVVTMLEDCHPFPIISLIS